MPAAFGDDTPSKYRFGDDEVSRLYFGDDLTWQRGNLFSDNFDRANSTNLGSDWTEFIGTGLAVTTNRLSGDGAALWNTDCLTDDQFSRITTGPNIGGRYILLLRCSPTMWPSIHVEITPSTGKWDIVTDASSGTGDHAVRATGVAGAITAGTDLRFEAVGNTYYVKFNNTQVGSWPDTGGLHSVGAGKRRVGARLVQVSTVNADDWSGGDL